MQVNLPRGTEALQALSTFDIYGKSLTCDPFAEDEDDMKLVLRVHLIIPIDDRVDCLGMTPFHILALSQRPSINFFEELTKLYPTNDISLQDKWGYLPIYLPIFYLFSNDTPEAVALFERLLELAVLNRLKFLGLKEWRQVVSSHIDAFYSADTSDRNENMKQVYYLLEKYER